MIIANKNQFHLKTKNSSYILCVSQNKWLVHLYWGEALSDSTDLTYTLNNKLCNRAMHIPFDAEKTRFMSDAQFELSTHGSGDYREPMFLARHCDGSTVTEFEFIGYEIFKNRKELPGQPFVYSENDAETLEITMKDSRSGLKAVLSYVVFEEYNVIIRNVRYINEGEGEIHLLTALSAGVDFFGQDYKMLNLNGDWTRERFVDWIDIKPGVIKLDSKRGMSSHMHNPFTIIAPKNTDEDNGEAFGFALCYSGGFEITAEGSSVEGTRVNIGINSFNFDWVLPSGEEFQTPDAILAYSGDGFNDLSGIYHKLIRERICRGKFRDMARPVVINSFEGVHFDFDEDKILKIANEAAKVGVEMFVLDDGWFGVRNDDTTSLGDWYVNLEKLPGGLSHLVDSINRMGMKFGIWVEPEMVSPDSELYRKHPDWCLYAEGRTRSESRNQLMLDFSRDEVCDYIIDALSTLFESANIEYVKWDCNRNLCETQNQMQTHKFTLGLYKVLDALNQRFPDILFEGCSSGGGRFDPAILYYMPQTWTSDDSTPIKRHKIQYGTSYCYPPISMTGHIGSIDVGHDRYNKYMNTSAMTAMAVNFGVEHDLTRLSEIEKEQIKGYIEDYKEIRSTVQFGKFYRVESPFEGDYVSWYFTDENQVVLFTYQRCRQLNGIERRIKLKGLEANAVYEWNGQEYPGDVLMNYGFFVPIDSYEYHSQCFVLKKM